METLTASRKYEKSADEIRNKESNTEMIERIEIKDTPFTAVRVENQWFLSMGKYRITEPTEDKEECMKEAENTTWNRIMQVVQIMVEYNLNKQ